MIRFLLKLTVSMLIIFTAFSIAARALGTTQPPNPALAGFTEGCEDIPQPCWYGIVPGVTPIDEAVQFVKNMGYEITPNGLTNYPVYTHKPPICLFGIDNDGQRATKIGLFLCSSDMLPTGIIITISPRLPKETDFAGGGFMNSPKRWYCQFVAEYGAYSS